jgi:hypothetical protein
MKKIINLILLLLSSYFISFSQNGFSKKYDFDKDVSNWKPPTNWLGWVGSEVAEIKDGYIVLATPTSTNPNEPTSGLMKIDKKGNIIWKKNFDQIKLYSNNTMLIQNDSIFLCAPVYSKNVTKNRILIFSLQGDSLGVFNFGTAEKEAMTHIYKTEDDNKFVAVGHVYSPDSSSEGLRIGLISQDWKTHSWKTIFNNYKYWPSNLATKGNNYYVGFQNGPYSCTYKLDKKLMFIEEKCAETENFFSLSTALATKKGFAIAHVIQKDIIPVTDTTTIQPTISSYDEEGSLLWRYSFKPNYTIIKESYKTIVTKNGDFVGVGTTTDNSFNNSKNTKYAAWIYRISSNGKLKWEKVFVDERKQPKISFGTIEFYDISETSDGGFIITGNIEDTSKTSIIGVANYTWVVKLDSSGCLKPNCGYEQLVANKDINELILPIKTSIYPNPVEKELFFKMEDVIFQNGELSLFDLQGKKINQFALNPKQENYNFDLSNQPNGIYLWQLRLDGKLRQQGKLVVMHEE